MAAKTFAQNLLNRLLQGDRPSLAKAITLVESSLAEHLQQSQELLDKIMPHTGKSIRIGLSGPPGVGKSTFIESFGLLLTDLDKKVAVLAIDPSSPIAGGSILGDKTRMEELSRRANVFIRPAPNCGSLGGVAHRTRESILLCEAAGFDVVLVETVGVGQSEYQAHSMVDFFMVLIPPNAGDELQGIKRGIIELADAIIVNKADGQLLELAKQTASQYKNALQFITQGHSSQSETSKDFWKPQVLLCSSLKGKQAFGLQEIWETVENFIEKAQKLGQFSKHRDFQNTKWVEKLVSEMLESKIQDSPHYQKVYAQQIQDMLSKKTTPTSAAHAIFQSLPFIDGTEHST